MDDYTEALKGLHEAIKGLTEFHKNQKILLDNMLSLSATIQEMKEISVGGALHLGQGRNSPMQKTLRLAARNVNNPNPL